MAAMEEVGTETKKRYYSPTAQGRGTKTGTTRSSEKKVNNGKATKKKKTRAGESFVHGGNGQSQTEKGKKGTEERAERKRKTRGTTVENSPKKKTGRGQTTHRRHIHRREKKRKVAFGASGKETEACPRKNH